MAYRAQNSTPEDRDRPLTVSVSRIRCHKNGCMMWITWFTPVHLLQVWTSTRRKARQTAEPFLESGIAVRHHSVLTQLNPGEVDGMTPAQIKVHMERVTCIRLLADDDGGGV